MSVHEFYVVSVGDCRLEWFERSKIFETASGRLSGGVHGFVIVEWGVGGPWMTYAVGKRAGGTNWAVNRWFFHEIRSSTSRLGALKGLGSKPKRKRVEPDREGMFRAFCHWVSEYQHPLFDLGNERDISEPYTHQSTEKELS